MKVNLIYPQPQKKKMRRSEIMRVAKWSLISAAYLCPIINLCVGGRAWSVIVLWSLFMAWSLLLSPDLIEYNRISQFIKLITQSCVLLALIDLFLAPGWAVEVLSIVCFSALLTVGILFFTDRERQTHNMRPMLLLAVAALIAAIAGVCFFHNHHWSLIVMGALSFALLAVCARTMGGDMVHELKKLFHIR